MYILRTVVTWCWSPVIIAALAVVGVVYEWPVGLMAVSVSVVLVVGLVVAVVKTRESQMERSLLSLRRLAGYFSRRFTGSSSLSIFAIIDTLFNVDNPQLWDWARSCDMSQRVFSTWCNSFIGRLESDTRIGRFGIYLRTYLDELWLMNNHYFDFVQQFYEIAEKVDIPPLTIDQYNRFVEEYNNFVDNFRDSIADLKRIAETEIEPPSVKLAQELRAAPPPEAPPESEEKPSRTAGRRGGGYYM